MGLAGGRRGNKEKERGRKQGGNEEGSGSSSSGSHARTGLIVPLRRTNAEGQDTMRVSNVAILSTEEMRGLDPRLLTLIEATKWGQRRHMAGQVKDDPVLVGPESDPIVATLL